MIDIDNLHKRYRTADGRVSEVLKGLSLRVPASSITAVVGPSGAGKSTLARCISLLERPDSGSIKVNGKDLSLLSGEALRRERRAIGTVFQSSALLNRKTAWQNIAVPLEYLGVVERDIKARVGELLESVGLSHKSGGLSVPAFRRTASAHWYRSRAGITSVGTAGGRGHVWAGSPGDRHGAGFAPTAT